MLLLMLIVDADLPISMASNTRKVSGLAAGKTKLIFQHIAS